VANLQEIAKQVHQVIAVKLRLILDCRTDLSCSTGPDELVISGSSTASPPRRTQTASLQWANQHSQRASPSGAQIKQRKEGLLTQTVHNKETPNLP